MASPSTMLTRHERFYFEDGNFRLEVDNTEYQVHMYLFKDYARNFPFTGKKHTRNLPNSTPHPIMSTKRLDFDRLLACLYPAELLCEEDRTLEEWISILKLATRWAFDSLRKRALNEIERCASPVDKIVLGREYGVSEFVQPAYLALCQSSDPLSEEDGDRLGMKDVINIYRVRQELWGRGTKRVAVNDVLEKIRVYFDVVAQPRPSSPPSPTSLSPAALSDWTLPKDGSAIPEKAFSSSDDVAIISTPSPGSSFWTQQATFATPVPPSSEVRHASSTSLSLPILPEWRIGSPPAIKGTSPVPGPGSASKGKKGKKNPPKPETAK